MAKILSLAEVVELERSVREFEAEGVDL